MEQLQAVTGELVHRTVVLVYCEEGQTGVVVQLEAVSGRQFEVEEAACTKHMSGSAHVTTCCKKHLTE